MGNVRLLVYGLLLSGLLCFSRSQVVQMEHIEKLKMFLRFKDMANALSHSAYKYSYRGQKELSEIFANQSEMSIDSESKDGAILAAALNEEFKITQFLIDNTDTINLTDRPKMNALILASYGGDLKKVMYLMQSSIDLSFMNSFSQKALFTASEKCHKNMVKFLFREKLKLDVNKRDDRSRTALDLASSICCPEVVEILIRNGASVDPKDENTVAALLDSSYKGCLEIVKLLIELGVEPTAVDSEGRNALMRAAGGGHKDVVDFFLVKNFKDLQLLDKSSRTALHHAAIGGSLDVVQNLIQLGLKLNAQDALGQTALMLSVNFSRVDVVKYLVGAKAKVALRDKQGCDALFFIPNDENGLQILDYLVTKARMNVNSRNMNRSTPLHEAVKNDNFEMVKYLVKKGANRNTADSQRKTPAGYIYISDNPRMVYWLERDLKYLLQEEIKLVSTNLNDTITAVVNETVMLYCNFNKSTYPTNWFVDGKILQYNREFLEHKGTLIWNVLNDYYKKFECEGSSALDLLRKSGRLVLSAIMNGSKSKSLFQAVEEGDLEVVRYYIDGKGIDPTISYSHEMSETLLHAAARQGQLNIVEYLVREKHLDVNFIDNTDTTALHSAVEGDHIQVVRFLVENGANVNLGTPIFRAVSENFLETVKYLVQRGSHLQHTDGRIVLHEASAFGYLEMVRYLVTELKMNVNARDNQGLTASHKAAYRQHLNVLQFLEAHGANLTLLDNQNKSVLFYSVKNKDLSMMEFLAENTDFDIYARNNQNETVFDVAAEASFPEGLRFLFEYETEDGFLERFEEKAVEKAKTRKNWKKILGVLDDIKRKRKNKEEQEKHHKRFNLIVAISLVVGLLLTSVTLFLFFHIRQAKKMIQVMKEAGLDRFEEGAINEINPELNLNDQADLLPYNPKFEVPKENIKLGKQLGAGAFGVVLQATVQGINPDGKETTVAVKMVKGNIDRNEIMRALVCELKIMVYLGEHLNVVNLLGAVTKNIIRREMMIIVEYCEFGNLKDFLLKHRFNFVDQIDQDSDEINFCLPPTPPADSDKLKAYDTIKKTTSVSTTDLVCWSFQVARGMEYLSSRKVLHGDLAARNVLLATGNIAKICDFGLARSLYKCEEYEKKSEGSLPVKWMAIESLRHQIFSTASDVWSFGVTMWELFSLSEVPYPELNGYIELFPKLNEGHRLEQPKFATLKIYDIMRACWSEYPQDRPTFDILVQNLSQILDRKLEEHFVKLNEPHVKTNAGSDYLKLDADLSTKATYKSIRATLDLEPRYVSQIH